MTFEELVQTYGHPITVSRGSHVFMQGDEDQALYVVRAGLLKASYIDAEGRETIKSFLQTGDVIGSLTSAYSKSTCSFDLTCLSECKLNRLDFDQLRKEAADDLTLAGQMIELLLAFAMKKERREYEFLCLSAEERYRLMIERSPDLVRQLTQNDIARYLGITPVALSRIRGRIAGKHRS